MENKRPARFIWVLVRIQKKVFKIKIKTFSIRLQPWVNLNYHIIVVSTTKGQSLLVSDIAWLFEITHSLFYDDIDLNLDPTMIQSLINHVHQSPMPLSFFQPRLNFCSTWLNISLNHNMTQSWLAMYSTITQYFVTKSGLNHGSFKPWLNLCQTITQSLCN